MVKFKSLKIGLIVMSVLMIGASTVRIFATENQTKLNVPQFVEQGGTLIIQPVNKPIYLHLKSDDKDSSIYYSTKKYDGIQSAETIYGEPILYKEYGLQSSLTITAVNRKVGYQDSDSVSKTYSSPVVTLSIKKYDVKCSKIKKEAKKISGTLAGISSLDKKSIRVTVKVKVKPAKGAIKTYSQTINVGKKSAKWMVKLKKAIKKKDVIDIHVSSKDCFISFSSPSANDSIIGVFSSVPRWKTVSSKVK